jgi:hypothetical protein
MIFAPLPGRAGPLGRGGTVRSRATLPGQFIHLVAAEGPRGWWLIPSPW